MTYEELKNLIINEYISKTGKTKTRKIPEHIKTEILNHTSFYSAYEPQHLSVRIYFIVNGIIVLNKCLECEKYIHPINLQKYKKQNYCSNQCSSSSSQVLNKAKNTNMEKYGVEYATQDKKTIEKQKQTNLKKYGSESVLQNSSILEKKIKTTIERHGIVSCFQDSNIQEKIKQTNLERYGVEYPLLNDEILNKSKITMLEKYGTPYPTQSHLTPETILIINNNYMFSEFINDKSIYEISQGLQMDPSSIYNIIKKYDAHDLYKKRGLSYLELEMKEFLDSKEIAYELNNRSILNGKELDFYLPEYNMAIEMNGIYYHNEKMKPDTNYHYNKWNQCHKQNIHLVSIFEDEWNSQKTKIKNMLNNHINKKERGIPARKTTIKRIDGKIAKIFLEKYHLQGYTSGKHYGAFDGMDNLIGVMTFGYTRNQRFELSRFVMDNYTHPGLFSKIFKYAQKDLNFHEVVSFSDNKHFTGNVYKMNGFKLTQVIKPDYKYIINGEQIHKSNFRKANIKKKYPHMTEMIDSGMSERKAMEYLGIPKIWDCGKTEWTWKC